MDRTRTNMDADFTLPPELVTAHAASLRALARSLAIDEHAADDVVQETWLRALSSPPAHQEGIGGWLRRVAEGFALKRHRSESRRVDRERKYALERPEAVTSADSRAETLRVVVDAVLSLEDPYRETVLLRWFEGLPPREIATRTKVSLATVNSRLQRAHAQLRDRLSRRLDLDDRRLQGVLLAIFGTSAVTTAEATTAAAVTSISLFGVTMTTTNVMIGGGLVAAGVCTVLFLSSPHGEPKPQEVAKIVPRVAQPADIESVTKPEVGLQRVEVGSVAPALQSESVPAIGAGPYEFELTVTPIDVHGRPVPHVLVRVGLEMQRLASLGSTGWNGELHSTWRGFEPSLDLAVELSGASASSCPLRKIHLAAGKPETITVAVDGRQGNSIFQLTFGGKLDAPVGNFPSSPTFAKDELGNGVFKDPWILGADEYMVEPAASKGGKIDEIRMVASDSATTHMGSFMASKREPLPQTIENSAKIEGIVRDEHGDPLPGILVTALTESDSGSWETTTDTSGRFSYAVPNGKVILLAGGGDRAVPRQDIELAAGETRTLDIQCVRFVMTHVRLLDDQKHPLVGWRVEGRQTAMDWLVTGRGDTDESGLATLFLPELPHGRVFLRPSSTSVLPKMKIDEPIVGRGSDGDIVLHESVSPGQLDLSVQTVHYAPVEARLWRADSKEGMRMPLVVAAATEESADHRNLFRAAGLLPGEYVIEFGARGVPWKRIGPFYLQPGQAIDAGMYTLESPTNMEVDGAGGAALTVVTARTRVQGLWLEGQAASTRAPAHMSLMPGEWMLSVESQDKTSTKSLLGSRAVNAEAARAIVLDLPEKIGSR